MKSVIQRVSSASVTIDNRKISDIDRGCVILLGVEKSDTEEHAIKLASKISKFRFFSDDKGKMNLNIEQVNGAILVVSQFTIVADTQSGNRPGFSQGASPEHGKRLYLAFINALVSMGITVQSGQFGADMQVSLVNDGPVTFCINN
ncbi:D-tyrosyl-tRNA(Tyr) deacylase [Alteromonas sp. 5E99-2]|uniref:D-aminoacyl-tRNA deacylase n=1 Tax=Alteromonas sp. 5E99-2 TaxID=2817683 RepID=UPI001A996008|nr:D-aminoacyl-tRNA deacylase [Alteromonas sp. 5E99-2]MBO1256953.1 D-tyrosyl-tRNA(Tyr) deacylase [Alteromonas sp. 5E99-2]